MRALLNCSLTVVSLYCDDDDDDDCDFTARGWTIGDQDIWTAAPAGDLWPHKVRDWEYWNNTSGEVESDPKLTVTGNIKIYIDMVAEKVWTSPDFFRGELNEPLL